MKIGDKVLFGGVEYKITQEIMGIYWGRKKHARQDTELPIDQIALVKKPLKAGLSKEDKKNILRDLVEAPALRENYIRELVLLNKLVSQFPSEEFWRECFKPALKVNSLTYWLIRQEVEDL